MLGWFGSDAMAGFFGMWIQFDPCSYPHLKVIGKHLAKWGFDFALNNHNCGKRKKFAHNETKILCVLRSKYRGHFGGRKQGFAPCSDKNDLNLITNDCDELDDRSSSGKYGWSGWGYILNRTKPGKKPTSLGLLFRILGGGNRWPVKGKIIPAFFDWVQFHFIVFLQQSRRKRGEECDCFWVWHGFCLWCMEPTQQGETLHRVSGVQFFFTGTKLFDKGINKEKLFVGHVQQGFLGVFFFKKLSSHIQCKCFLTNPRLTPTCPWSLLPPPRFPVSASSPWKHWLPGTSRRHK